MRIMVVESQLKILIVFNGLVWLFWKYYMRKQVPPYQN
jgi:hypothetical protein